MPLLKYLIKYLRILLLTLLNDDRNIRFHATSFKANLEALGSRRVDIPAGEPGPGAQRAGLLWGPGGAPHYKGTRHKWRVKKDQYQDPPVRCREQTRCYSGAIVTEPTCCIEVQQNG